MMNLSIQIESFSFSFLYGILYYLFLKRLLIFMNGVNNIQKILYSIVFTLLESILYFLILIKINNGIIHVYFILMIFCGYFLCKFIVK